VDVTLLNRLL